VGERKEGDKGTRGINERTKEGEGLRHGRNHSALNSTAVFILVQAYYQYSSGSVGQTQGWLNGK
jgi:hypothetical protein